MKAHAPAVPGKPPVDLRDGWRGVAVAGLVVSLVFFGGIGTWAATAPLSSAAVAPGFVRVEDHRQAVQHRDGGIVRELLVQDGQTVEKGQALLRLDTTEMQAEIAVYSGQINAQRAQRARLIAERDGADKVRFDPDLDTRRRADPDLDATLRGQEKLFQARREALKNQELVLRQRAQQLAEQGGGYEQQLRATQAQLVLIEKELGGKRSLLEKGLIREPEVLALERTAVGLSGTIGQLRASKASTAAGIAEIESTILQLQRERVTEVASLLRETEQKLFDLEPRFSALQAIVARADLRAPMSGVVVGMTVFTEGGIIRAGDKVMDIVPAERPLVIEAQVPLIYADGIRSGQSVEIQLAAFGRRRQPIIYGEVESISADRVFDERSGTPFYKAIVRVQPEQLAQADVAAFIPGMQADVMIALKRRTVLEYLISPLTDVVRRGMREP